MTTDPVPTDAAGPVEPVTDVLDEESAAGPKGIGLCLSGGGYRAMLFHLGVLWRLNDAGRLPKLDRISSVSGGSITAGVLAKHWSSLRFDGSEVATNFRTEVVGPLRRMANQGIDVAAVLLGAGLPFSSVSERVTKAYRRHLFGTTTLQDLPEHPRFVFNATNLESGALMRFSRPYLADYRVGRVANPELPLALVVTASSAFPPFLSPCTVDLEDENWQTDRGNDLTDRCYRERIRLSDGGVYDNLGLETAWKSCRTLLVSDAGGRVKADCDPPTDWGRHTVRVLEVIDNQVRSLRKRQLIAAFRAGTRDGMYVGIRSDVADFGLPDAMPADPRLTATLAETPTRLDRLDDERQELLVNWGYTICDAGLRRHVDPSLSAGTLPFPQRQLA